MSGLVVLKISGLAGGQYELVEGRRTGRQASDFAKASASSFDRLPTSPRLRRTGKMSGLDGGERIGGKMGGLGGAQDERYWCLLRALMVAI